jgi:hypothetical protein
MKKLTKSMLLALCCTALVSLSSCLKDNDDEPTYSVLTEAETTEYINSIGQHHYGKVKVYFGRPVKQTDGTYQTVADSAIANTELSVSTSKNIHFHGFPVCLLKNYLEDNEENKSLIEALDNAADVPMDVDMTAFWKMTDKKAGTEDKYFYMMPTGRKLEFTLNYGGVEHKAAMEFTEQFQYGYTLFTSQGYLDTRNKLHMFYIMKNFTVDSQTKVTEASFTYIDN